MPFGPVLVSVAVQMNDGIYAFGRRFPTFCSTDLPSFEFPDAFFRQPVTRLSFEDGLIDSQCQPGIALPSRFFCPRDSLFDRQVCF